LVKIIDPYYYLRLLYANFKLQPSKKWVYLGEKLWCHQT
jgi:hypothetical protein